MNERVVVAGVGIHPFGRFDGLTNTDMGVHAVRAALIEAREPRLDAAFCGTAYGGVASGHKVLGAHARTGIPIVDIEAGCASGGAAATAVHNHNVASDDSSTVSTSVAPVYGHDARSGKWYFPLDGE